MEVKLRATKDGNFLEVAVLNETHKHKCEEVCCVLWVEKYYEKIEKKFKSNPPDNRSLLF